MRPDRLGVDIPWRDESLLFLEAVEVFTALRIVAGVGGDAFTGPVFAAPAWFDASTAKLITPE